MVPQILQSLSIFLCFLLGTLAGDTVACDGACAELVASLPVDEMEADEEEAALLKVSLLQTSFRAPAVKAAASSPQLSEERQERPREPAEQQLSQELEEEENGAEHEDEEEEEDEEDSAAFLQEGSEIVQGEEEDEEEDKQSEAMLLLSQGLAQLQQRLATISSRLDGVQPEAVAKPSRTSLLSISSVADLAEGISDLEESMKRLSMEVDGASPEGGACVWAKRPWRYSPDYASDEAEYELEGAQEQCMRLGPSVCKAVTCQASGACTVRASPFLSRSPWNETTYVPSAACMEDLYSKARPWSFVLLPASWLGSFWSDLFIHPRPTAWKQLAVFVVCFVGAVVAGTQVKQHRWAGNMCGGRTPAPIPGLLIGFVCILVAAGTCHPAVPWLLMFIMFFVAYILPQKV